MAKKLTPEQEEEFTLVTTNSHDPLLEDPFCRNLSDKRDRDLLLSPELEAFFGKEFAHLLLGR